MSTGRELSDFADAFFNPVAQPPDSVPLRVLGLEAMPASHEALKTAYVSAVKRNHPDVATRSTTTMDELVWARTTLQRRIPVPVTDERLARGDLFSRNGESGCNADGCDEKRSVWFGGKWDVYCFEHGRLARNAEAREARRRARADRICDGCETTFTPTRSDGRYCLSACRQRAYRKRKAAA